MNEFFVVGNEQVSSHTCPRVISMCRPFKGEGKSEEWRLLSWGGDTAQILFEVAWYADCHRYTSSQTRVLANLSPTRYQSDVLFIGMKLTAQCEPCTGLQDKIKWKTFLCQIYMNKNILSWRTGNDGSCCWMQRGVHVVTEVALIFFFLPISFSYVDFKYRIPSYIYICIFLHMNVLWSLQALSQTNYPPPHAISTPWL